MSESAHLAFGLAACALLLVHAGRTHGGWFAGVWLVLPALLGVALEILERAHGPGREIGEGLDPLGRVVADGARWSVVVYLGGLYAKGFVERTRKRGSIAAFVAAHALFAVVVAAPLEAASVAAIAVHPSAEIGGGGAIVSPPRLGAYAAGAAAFGLAYRVTSRLTQDDRRKFAVLLAALPLVASVPAGVVWLTRIA